MWTMEELLERVREALAAEYPGAPNGRVRELPDRRAVRWYTTTGLVDRAAAMRGRTALYGPRHLLQIVAVKRRQAAGHSLATIQAELAGATDAELAALARVPAALLDTGPPTPDDTPARPRFWATPPAPPGTADPAAPGTTEPAMNGTADPAAPDVDEPAAPGTTEPAMNGTAPASGARDGDAPAGTAREVGGVALGGGAFLLLPVRPSARDLDDLADAAQPLIDLLKARGLLTDGGTR